MGTHCYSEARQVGDRILAVNDLSTEQGDVLSLLSQEVHAPAGACSRLIDFVYHSTLGLRVHSRPPSRPPRPLPPWMHAPPPWRQPRGKS